jgi:hypothetical protein
MPDPGSTLPYPLLVNALTGEPQPAIPFPDIASPRPLPKSRPDPSALGFDPNAIKDPNDLTQTGWGIIFASDADPAIQAQLQPLIDLRKSNVQDDNLFKIFSGSSGPLRGVLPGETAESWAQQLGPSGVSLDNQVDPSNGLPYYLLIVGSPEKISFTFQADLKSQWVVGRLYFDDLEDYGRYAQAVVQYEDESYQPVQTRSSALWVTRNPGDLATALLSGTISNTLLPPGVPLGQKNRFLVNPFVNEKATKPQLIEILRGNVPVGPPAVIFTGCHGCDYSGADADTQRRLQGSFLTQEWVPKTPGNAGNQFTADDVPADAQLLGTVGFLFACYSGACPALDSYRFNPDGSPIKVAPQPMISRIPQALLSRGMLAAIAHIDLAFPYAFQDVNGTPQVQAIRSPLEQIMDGSRIGYAADSLTALWNTRSSRLGVRQGVNATPPSTPKEIATLTIARDDAGNYIVLGDPATQLRVDDLH